MLQIKLNILKNFVSTCSRSSGVYKIFGTNNEILYIGKAKNLYMRVKSYQNVSAHSLRIISMLSQMERIATIVTKDEIEALLLESNLIKQHKPKYNILFKDNKTFPYICLDESSGFPRIFKYRGNRLKGKLYYGPFTSVKKLDEAILALQRIFLLRSCTDTYFKNRTRPCILYQIKRCSGPCVNKINDVEYKTLVSQVKNFLSGKSQNLQKQLISEMQAASKNLEYEKAAIYRDRINALTFIQAQNQFATFAQISNVDVICSMVMQDEVVAKTQTNLFKTSQILNTRSKSKNSKNTQYPILDVDNPTLKIMAIQIFFIRSGCNFGNKIYYLYDIDEKDVDENLINFLQNFYKNNILPPEILINKKLEDVVLLEQLFLKLYNHKVKISHPIRGKKLDLVKFVEMNLESNLKMKVLSQVKHNVYFDVLKEYFKLSKLNRIEIYDNSHTSGFEPGGAVVMCSRKGFIKSNYRRYSIKLDHLVHDDHFILENVLLRRFKSKMEIPDMIIIDGGKGQLSTAIKVISKMKIKLPFIISLAKGKQRNSGQEIIYTSKNKNICLNKNNSMKQYLQILRDEAHRFAITSHKLKREKAMFKTNNNVGQEL